MIGMGHNWLITLYMALHMFISCAPDSSMDKETALRTIHDISTGNMGTLCLTDTDNFKSLPIVLEASRFDSSRQKMDMTAILLQELGANHHNRGLADAVSRSLILSDHRVLAARVVTLNVSTGHIITPAFWRRPSSDLADPEPLSGGPKPGSHLDPALPWYEEPSESSSPLESPKFALSPANASFRGWWTFPYYSCADKKWIISYSVAVPPVGRHPTKGYLSIDVDVSWMNVNQCDVKELANEIDAFHGTHKCHNLTSMCVRNPGARGWQRGGYHCTCRQGYFSLSKAGVYNGTLVEAAWSEKEGNVSQQYDEVFKCHACAPGCSSCRDFSLCLASYNWPFRITLLVVSMSCVVFTLSFILFVCKHRRLKVFKVSSPIFLCITLCGCSIMYLEMATIFPVLDTYSCIATKWTRHLGFCLTYTALLMKTWRVSLTYRVKSAHKVKLTDKQLLQWMLPILLVMVIYLGSWTLSDPPTAVDLEDSEGLKFKQCSFNWWDHSIAIGEVLFLSWGIRVCYNVRNAESFYNEAHLISYAIYNIAIVNTTMVAFHILLFPNAGPDIKYLLGFIRTQLSTSVTIGFVFGPKVIRVMRGQGDQWDNRARARGVTASFSLNGIGLVHEETADLYHENEELKEEIQKLAGQIEFMRIVHMETNNRHLRPRPGSYFQAINAQVTMLQSPVGRTSNFQKSEEPKMIEGATNEYV